MNLKYGVVSPVRGNPVITSPYGLRVLNGQKQFHDGIDIICGLPDVNINDRLNPIGTEVKAIAAGNICYDFDKYDDRFRLDLEGHKNDSAGNMVIIKTVINNVIYYVRYLHLIENYVSENQFVPSGMVIGKYADVGFSYGAHLHLDIYTNDWSRKIDPALILFDT